MATIRHDPGVPDESRLLAKQSDISQAAQDKYVANGGKLYTRPLINYDMALFMSPIQMAGAVLGVLVQKVIPNWLYLLFAGMVLSYTSYRTYKKYFASRQKEIEKAQAAAAQEKPTMEEAENEELPAPADNNDNQTQASGLEESSSLEAVEVEEGTKEVPQNAAAATDAHLELRKEYLEEDMRQFPKEKIRALFLLWIGLFVLTLFQGGKGVESLVGIDCDSP